MARTCINSEKKQHLNLTLSVEAKEKLSKLSQHYKMSQSELIEKLVSDECDRLQNPPKKLFGFLRAS